MRSQCRLIVQADASPKPAAKERTFSCISHTARHVRSIVAQQRKIVKAGSILPRLCCHIRSVQTCGQATWLGRQSGRSTLARRLEVLDLPLPAFGHVKTERLEFKRLNTACALTRTVAIKPSTGNAGDRIALPHLRQKLRTTK